MNSVTDATASPSPPRLLDQVRSRTRALDCAIRTEEAYVDWIKRFIRFFDRRHPREMGASEVDEFLAHLMADRNVAASTHHQARSALLFLYREVLQIELSGLDGAPRANVSRHRPVALTRSEVDDVLRHLRSTSHRLIGTLLYGSGMRLEEVLRLRVRDIDLARSEIVVRDGKVPGEGVTTLPQVLSDALASHLASVEALHRVDLAAGHGRVYLPLALARDHPGAAREWRFQYVFPASTATRDPRSRDTRRHHIQAQAFQRAFRQAVSDAGLTKPATPHALRAFVARPVNSPRWEPALWPRRIESRDLFHRPG